MLPNNRFSTVFLESRFESTHCTRRPNTSRKHQVFSLGNIPIVHFLIQGKIARQAMMPILIVDDSSEDAALASRVLDQCKVLNPVHILKSGAECIAYFVKTGSHHQGTLPCLVLLDLAMKPTTGIDVLHRVRNCPSAWDSIFVMLSGISDFSIIHQGYQLGAATFLIKPLRTEDVIQMLEAVRGIAARRAPDGYIITPSFQNTGSSSSVPNGSRSESSSVLPERN